MDESLYRQVGANSWSQALALMGNFHPPDTCWRENTAGNKQSRRFLECFDDNFILQLIEKPVSGGVMPEFVLITRRGWWAT